MVSLALVACGPKETPPPVTRSDDEILQIAKSAAQAAFERLSGELGAAIAEGGPTHAIPICSEKAGELTGEVAAAKGVTMVRLSDKPRNPGQRATGDDLAALEAMREKPAPQLVRRDDGSAVVRLPIVLGNPLCLKCHGGADDIDAGTLSVLNERYPADEATGYRLDELRGIWRIEVPPGR